MPSGKCPYDCPLQGEDENSPVLEAGMLKQTDSILPRTLIFSVGVVDSGLGGNVGINILSSDEEIKQVAEHIRSVIIETVQNDQQ